MPNVIVALPNIDGAVREVWLASIAQVPCSNATKIRERKQDWENAKSILHLAKFRNGTKAPENVYVVYQRRRRSNTVQSLIGFR